MKELFRDEIIQLYASEVRSYFTYAANRDAYSWGVELLRKLISYGGEQEANQIANELKSRRPRRSALIDELSQL